MRLAPASFVRVHRSAIVNVQFVQELHHHSDGSTSVVLDRAEVVPFGPKFRGRLERAVAPERRRPGGWRGGVPPS